MRHRVFSRNKHAAIELQFNWIFILIVGGLIILFFYLAINKHQGVAEVSINTEVRSKLKTILTSGQQSAATTYDITIPDQDITFACDGFALGDTAPIDIDAAFAPTKLKSRDDTFIVSAQPFSFPYQAGNFLYVTSKDVRYIFYNAPTDTAGETNLKMLMEDTTAPSLPKDATKEQTTDCNLLKDVDNYQVIFIFWDEATTKNNVLTGDQESCASAFEAMNPKDVKAIKIDPRGNAIDGFGFVYFYQLSETTAKFEPVGDIIGSPYLSRASLLGAITGADQETFECSMKDMVHRLHIVSHTYMNKAIIHKGYDFGDRCRLHYGYAKTSINDLYLATEAENAYKTGAQSIYERMNEVKARNTGLALYSCPLIY